MNNTELDKLLQTASVPERATDFWEQLPRRISTRIHWQARREIGAPDGARKALPLAWAFAAGAFCLLLALTLPFRPGQTSGGATGQYAQMAKCYREIEALFPNQLQSITFDERGSHLLLAERADVPQSPALYLKICGPSGCQQVVTFSGQQIRVNGDDCDVLVDAAGNILVVGRQIAWSSAAPARVGKPYRIEARALETHT
jgi:hypothetical protein